MTALPLLLTLALLVPAPQKGKGPANAPENCPYCGGDPARMTPAGIVSHGGFEFGRKDTAQTDAMFGGKDVYWIETAHFELGMCLTREKVSIDEQKKVRAELAELALVLPEVPLKPRVVDPWLRIHLYGLRAEKLWTRFLEVMQVKESDFPDGKTQWLIGTPYWGEGPYLGQKGKYELLLVPSAFDQVTYLKNEFGLSVKRTQRWNVLERDSLIVVTNLTENKLTNDQRIHGHFVFNLTHNLLDGFKHYSYDTPRWISEGLAHALEREVDPRFNTYDSSEGSVGFDVSKEDWDAEVAALVRKGDAPRLAELTALKTFAEFDLDDHYACWSMTRFMIETNPAGYACLNGKLHGRKGPDGTPENADMTERQRELFAECFGMNYFQFDDAWKAWALER